MTKHTMLWCVYWKGGKEHAFEFTEEEKSSVPINDVLEKHEGKDAVFITMQVAFDEAEAVRKTPRL